MKLSLWIMDRLRLWHVGVLYIVIGWKMQHNAWRSFEAAVTDPDPIRAWVACQFYKAAAGLAALPMACGQGLMYLGVVMCVIALVNWGMDWRARRPNSRLDFRGE